MRTGQQDPRLWGLGLTAAMHALLWLAVAQGSKQPQAARPSTGPALTVVLAATPPAPRQAGPVQELSAPLAAPEPIALPEVPLREDLYYYFPQELDRQLIVLRDRSGEADIELTAPVVMHLFVDLYGKVSAISFEGEAPPAALQEQLRAAFMTMEFLPGLKDGFAVPARLKIAISRSLPPSGAGSEVPDT